MAVSQDDKMNSETPSANSTKSDNPIQRNQENEYRRNIVAVASLSNSNESENVSSTENQIKNLQASNSSATNSDNLLSSWKTQNWSNFKLNDVSDAFKGDNLQQLSTNALPSYTPGSPPGFIKPNARIFEINCCVDCGDTFVLKSSLDFHLERRSVLIKFPCDACKHQCVFYNRCNLLSHIRSHSDKNEKVDISKAVVSVLPRVLMDGIQNDFVNNLDDELNIIENNDVLPPTELLECSFQELDETVPVKESENNSISRVKCLDCNEEFLNPKEREEHLINGGKMPVLVSQCNKCGLLCPSKCSLKAHQRIHLQISPYVCPECGDSPDPHWIAFLHHVNFKCFHNCRSVGYKCPVCKQVSPNNDELLKHMESHTEKYAKCAECPRAYNSAAAFKAHNNIYHNGQSAQYTMIYKCSLCDIVFVSNDQMLAHRSTHLKEPVCEYIFNCLQCGKALDNKKGLIEHIKTDHPKIYKQSVQSELVINKPPASAVNFKGTVECILCNVTFHSHQSYSTHISQAHLYNNKGCCWCGEFLLTRKEIVKHGKIHLKNKAFLCLLCNKRVNNEKDLDSHLDDHIKKLKFCSFCPVCDNLFPNPTDSLNHLREEHLLPKKSDIDPHESTLAHLFKDIICHYCRDLFASESELQSHIKKEHSGGSACSGIKRSLSLESNEEPPSKKYKEGNSCAKCQFHSVERDVFKKHILTHKTDRSTFQCQECGLCFVVLTSLAKHLRIIHKINDTDKYILDEGTNFLPEIENPTEVSKRNALECTVCFTSFPNETSLKTHMRSHGMAFIQANKSGLL